MSEMLVINGLKGLGKEDATAKFEVNIDIIM
jgi:hypothetical protein